MNKNVNQFVAPVLAMTLAAGFAAGCGKSETLCGRAISQPYPGDPQASSDRHSWRLAVEAIVANPNDANITASWAVPPEDYALNPQPETLHWHDSNPITATRLAQAAGHIAFRLGNGALIVSIYAKSKDGGCLPAPAVEFSHPDLGQLPNWNVLLQQTPPPVQPNWS